MNDHNEDNRVNVGYVLAQLDKAMANDSLDGTERARKWRDVIVGMLTGKLNVGSRTPVADTPSWLTLDVVHGGFATGGLAGSGPIKGFEVRLLKNIDRPVRVAERMALNAYFLTEIGSSQLTALLASGAYRVNVPEEAALLAVSWLRDNDENDRATDILDAIAPYFDRVRFYPEPLDDAPEIDDTVCVTTFPDAAKALRRKKENRNVAVMKETLLVWTPLYDRTVELFLETVEGEVPHFERDADGLTRRTETGQPIPDGGWPCKSFPDGWNARAQELLDAYAEARKAHRLSSKPEKKDENFYLLRGFLAKCVTDSSALDGWDVGMIRNILAGFVTKHGAPGSEKRIQTREAQLENAGLPDHHLVAHALADRLDNSGQIGGVANVDTYVGPLTEDEAASVGAAPGTSIPRSSAAVVRRCLRANIEVLVEHGILTSAESVARLLPQLTAHTRAQSIESRELARLYEMTYQAFRNRRSLLLLDLEHQVRMEELPWFEQISPWLLSDIESKKRSKEALARVMLLVLRSFPQTVLPNKLVREVREMADAAGLHIPLSEEIAADIFMGTFSAQHVRAAQMAVPLLKGTLYARYFGIPLDRVESAKLVERQENRAKTSPEFDSLVAELAGNPDGDRWSVSRNGAIIEWSQILSTHNLVQLLWGLDLQDPLRNEFPELAKHCFSWVLKRQQLKLTDWHPMLQNVKNSAYAWRQMLVYLSMASDDEVSEFLLWARDQLSAQDRSFREQLEPALRGVEIVVAGGEFARGGTHESGARRFTGWTQGRHWMFPPKFDSAPAH